MNELKQIDAFRQVLSDYHLSEAAKATLASTELGLLIGPTSSGKNTIVNELLKANHYHPIISDTTRQPRSNDGVMEQNGVEYWFRTEDEMLADLQAGAFLEAAIIHEQQVSGISIRELQAAANEGKVALNEIEVVGADNIYASKPDTMFFFVLPPSFDEWMVRMSGRGSLAEDEVRRRLESAVNEITTALERDYYWFVVNDTFVQTAHKIDAAIIAKANDRADQAHGREVAEQLIAETKAHLA
jgi:guanylate kinase